MKATLRRLLTSRLLRRLGVAKAAFRIYETYQTRMAVDTGYSGDLPLPPARLRVLVAGIADADYFLDSGLKTAEIVADCVRRRGRDISEIGALLDFGCGCGRVARHWPEFTQAQVFGSDYNPQLVAWVRGNLPSVNAVENQLEPPLPFETARFDLVYAISVFTHLTEELQKRWVDELGRVIRPGGLLVFTTHGEGHVDRLVPSEQERFNAGEMIVQFDEMEGSNWCAAFHPQQYVTQHMLSSAFALRDFREGDSALPQDGWTAERVDPGESAAA